MPFGLRTPFVCDAVQRILTCTVDGEQAFLCDSKTQDAVILNIEIISEATRKLSDEPKNKHHDIPWKPMAGMRNILIHHCFDVKLAPFLSTTCMQILLRREVETTPSITACNSPPGTQ